MAIAGNLGLSIAVVDRLTAIVISALGADWLNAAARDIPPSTPLPFPRQHLGHLFHVAGEEQLAEVLELGEYLEALHNVPGIESAITNLKTSYFQTLLQLGFAARFSSVGATIERLEPPAANGRVSDIRMHFGSSAIRIECYRPTYKPNNEVTNELVRLAQAILRRAGEAPGVYAIGIDLRVRVTPALRHELEEIARLAIKEIVEAPNQPGMLPTILTTSDSATISVCPSPPTVPEGPRVLARHPDFPKKGNDFGFFMRVNVANAMHAGGIFSDLRKGVGRSCIGIWSPDYPPTPATQPMENEIARFARKVEKKLVQARSELADSRIIVVDARDVRRLDNSDNHVARLRGKLLDAHHGVEAILLTHRRWVEDLGRYGYPLTALSGASTSSSVLALLKALTERHHDTPSKSG